MTITLIVSVIELLIPPGVLRVVVRKPLRVAVLTNLRLDYRSALSGTGSVNVE
jgi:hypothetical protein